MKAIVAAVLLGASMGSLATTECYQDGVAVEVPDGWFLVVVPEGKNTAPKNRFYNPNGAPQGGWELPVDACEGDQYASGCPLACDGETPGDKCKRQRPPFPECANPGDGLVIGPGGC